MLKWQACGSRARVKRISAVAFSPNGLLLASGDTERQVRLWNPATGKAFGPSVYCGVRDPTLLFSPDGQFLVAAGEGVAQFRVQADHSLAAEGIPGGSERECWTSGIAFTPDGQHLLLAETVADRAILGLGYYRPRRATEEAPSDETAPSGRLALAADGTLATGLQRIKVWRGQRGLTRVLAGARSDLVLVHRDPVESLAFSPAGNLLATAADKVVRLWAVDNGKEVRVLKGHGATVVSLAWHPAGGILASASHDGTVRFWEVPEGRQRTAFDWEIGKVQCVVFACDGMRSAACGDQGEIVVWDVDHT